MSPDRSAHPRRIALAIALVLGLGLACAAALILSGGWPAKRLTSASRRLAGHPAITSHVRVCGIKSVLADGPSAPPRGAVRVRAGDDARVNWTRAHVTYWLAPGVHTLGRGKYTQIGPGSGATFVGAPGAVIDGLHQNYYAFGGSSPDVTISYLTIRNFGVKGGNMNEGVVNHDSATGWVIDHSTITGNAGAGVMLGSHDTLSYDCLSDNQQYGFNAVSPKGPSGIIMTDNEIVGNDTYNWERHLPGCGCTGGGKFWVVNGAVITHNWVHDNHSVGMWADTNNRGFDISDNYFQDNYDEGLVYEISYNALIQGNVFAGNGIGGGPRNGFPTAAIYISESGSDSRVRGPFGDRFLITGNRFINNWSGVILWENSNRFCGSPANSSTGACTLVDPAVANIHTCGQAHLAGATRSQVPDYFDSCRWKAQNIFVEHNVFDFSPRALGPSCTLVHGCGFQGVFSEAGTVPSWSPYQGTIVEEHITFDQNNHFDHNTYNGPWRFMALELGDVLSWSRWRRGYGQDLTSTLNRLGT